LRGKKIKRKELEILSHTSCWKPLKGTLFRVFPCKYNSQYIKPQLEEVKSKMLKRKKTHQRTKMKEPGDEKKAAMECGFIFVERALEVIKP
jgi:hypothetical protein